MFVAVGKITNLLLSEAKFVIRLKKNWRIVTSIAELQVNYI